jgi:hypothetical protein
VRHATRQKTIRKHILTEGEETVPEIRRERAIKACFGLAAAVAGAWVRGAALLANEAFCRAFVDRDYKSMPAPWAWT